MKTSKFFLVTTSLLLGCDILFTNKDSDNFIPGELVVSFAYHVTAQDARTLVGGLGLQVKNLYIPSGFVSFLVVETGNVSDKLAMLSADTLVYLAEQRYGYLGKPQIFISFSLIDDTTYISRLCASIGGLRVLSTIKHAKIGTVVVPVGQEEWWSAMLRQHSEVLHVERNQRAGNR